MCGWAWLAAIWAVLNAGHAFLFSHGSQSGDTDLLGDRSPLLDLTPPFPFYGYKHSQILIYRDAFLTFDNTTRDVDMLDQHCIPAVVIWGSVILTESMGSSGTVTYRLTKEPECLYRISDLAQSFKEFSARFQPKYALIVTWDNVDSPSYDNISETQVNSFQLVLSTDGEQSLALLDYERVDWIVDRPTGYHEEDGSDLPVRAQVGFYRGDGTYHLLPGSFTPATENITEDTNANMTGLYVFRLDQIPTDLTLVDEEQRSVVLHTKASQVPPLKSTTTTTTTTATTTRNDEEKFISKRLRASHDAGIISPQTGRQIILPTSSPSSLSTTTTATPDVTWILIVGGGENQDLPPMTTTSTVSTTATAAPIATGPFTIGEGATTESNIFTELSSLAFPFFQPPNQANQDFPASSPSQDLALTTTTSSPLTTATTTPAVSGPFTLGGETTEGNIFQELSSVAFPFFQLFYPSTPNPSAIPSQSPLDLPSSPANLPPSPPNPPSSPPNVPAIPSPNPQNIPPTPLNFPSSPPNLPSSPPDLPSSPPNLPSSPANLPPSPANLPSSPPNFPSSPPNRNLIPVQPTLDPTTSPLSLAFTASQAAQDLPSIPPSQDLPSTSPTQDLPSSPPSQDLPPTPPTQVLPSIPPIQDLPSIPPSHDLPSIPPTQDIPSIPPSPETASVSPPSISAFPFFSFPSPVDSQSASHSQFLFPLPSSGGFPSQVQLSLHSFPPSNQQQSSLAVQGLIFQQFPQPSGLPSLFPGPQPSLPPSLLPTALPPSLAPISNSTTIPISPPAPPDTTATTSRPAVAPLTLPSTTTTTSAATTTAKQLQQQQQQQLQEALQPHKHRR